MMSATYESEQTELKSAVKKLHEEIQVQEQQIQNLEVFIKRVEVHHPQGTNALRPQRVNFDGTGMISVMPVCFHQLIHREEAHKVIHFTVLRAMPFHSDIISESHFTTACQPTPYLAKQSY